jgi:uncharacterized lipoprotein YmbA
MKKSILLVIVSLLFAGCSTFGARESIVLLPNGDEYRVTCQSNGKLDYSTEDVQITVDNRGRPGILEQVFGIFALTLPDTLNED